MDAFFITLNAKASAIIKWQWIQVDCSTPYEGMYMPQDPINVKNYYPSASVVIGFGGRKSGTNLLATAAVDQDSNNCYFTAPQAGVYTVLIVGIYDQLNS